MNRNAIVILILLLLVGCGTVSKTPVSQYKGTDGLQLSFLSNAPPDKVYEARPFPVKLDVRNAGAADVNYSRMIIDFSYDPLYIQGQVGIYEPGRYDTMAKGIRGRSQYYPQGESRIFSIPTDKSFMIKQVIGEREAPETELVASLCYGYVTHLSTPVCIDTNMYDENQRKQACTAKDLSFSGGQGAPIAIEKVEVRMLPVISQDRAMESVRPEFHITIRDHGKGYLIGPDNLPMSSACLLKGIPRDQLSSVIITAYLHNTKLECGVVEAGSGSGTIRLLDGTGEVSCTVPENELTNPIYLSKQNFQSMLTINLTYYYKTTVTKKLTIERSGATESELPNGLTQGKLPGYLYAGDRPVLDDAGRPITLCSYYADNPNAAPATLQGRINGNFSCSCGNDRCLALSRDGRCLFGDICPSGTYCCTDSKIPQTQAG